MVELLEQYICSIFLTSLFVWLPLYFIFQYPIMNFYKEDEYITKIDSGKSKKRAEFWSTIISILFLSAILLFVYKLK